MSPLRQTNFRLEEHTLRALEQIREKSGIPVSEQVRRALGEWIESNDVGRSKVATTVRQYTCVLIGADDVQDDCRALVDVLNRWNGHIGKNLNASVQVVYWRSHGVPTSLTSPQQSLNEQLVDSSDFGIAVLWARLGTPTATDESGSVEEIRRLTERGARVLIYFKTAPVSQEESVITEFLRLKSYKDKLRKTSLYFSYADAAELSQNVQLHVTSVVSELLARDRGTRSPLEVVQTAPRPDIRVVPSASLVAPDGSEVLAVMSVAVQNHSATTIHISAISLKMSDGTSMFAPRDAVTGAQQLRRSLDPGRSYTFFYSTDDLKRAAGRDHIVCAVARDDIGREYTSDPDDMQKVLRQLEVLTDKRGRRKVVRSQPK